MIKIDNEKCTMCGSCAEVCPVEAIKVSNVAIVNQEECLECGACASECPSEAITLPDSEKISSIAEHITPVLKKGSKDELVQMYMISGFGKDYFSKYDEFQKDQDLLKNRGMSDKDINEIVVEKLTRHFQIPDYSKDIYIDMIPRQMQEAIQEGFEGPLGMKTAYTEQLKLCIGLLIDVSLKAAKDAKDSAWEKSLKDNRKALMDTPDCSESTAKKHEETVVSLLLEGYLRKLSPEERKKLEEEIKSKVDSLAGTFGQGVNAGQLMTSFSVGGLTALRSIMGFQFHKMLAIIVNAVSKALFGVGLPFAWNAILQRFAGILFGPLGWVITIVTTIPSIAALVNPRKLDRYIPCVVYIYMLRHKDDIQFIKNLPEN